MGGDDIGDDQGARVDEGGARIAILNLQQDQRVESRSRRFSTDPLPNTIRPDSVEGEQEREDF